MHEDTLKLIGNASHIVVIQAENPDADSLASALALESLIEENLPHISVIMYCSVDMPKYLRYLSGWDRVVRDFPKEFELSIFVDASTQPLLERVLANPHASQLSAKPAIVIDHHDEHAQLPFDVHESIDVTAVATGQIIYEIAATAGWTVSAQAANMIASSIMADSLGLSSPKTTARSIEVVARCVEAGASLSELDERRKEYGKKSIDIFHYKGRLFERVELHENDRIAYVHIPWEEIEEFSNAYNPSMLIIDEMRMIEGVDFAAVFKTYPDGKLTCKLRANPSAQFMDELAGHFGGGGHPFAAGFKVHGSPIETIKTEMMQAARDLFTRHD